MDQSPSSPMGQAWEDWKSTHTVEDTIESAIAFCRETASGGWNARDSQFENERRNAIAILKNHAFRLGVMKVVVEQVIRDLEAMRTSEYRVKNRVNDLDDPLTIVDKPGST